ncbi:L-fuculokinase [Sodalis sp. TME1]|nr:L-fuculokinase [Sodalis sp. TME1]
MNRDVVIVLDCGATSIRAIAVDAEGRLVAQATTPNATAPAAENPQWHIWPLEPLLQRFAYCCQQIMPQLRQDHIHALTVTTFGVDGAPVDQQGELLYPVISWKCPRTTPIMAQIGRLISPHELQVLSGIGQFSFNTLYKLLWLQQNHPRLMERAHCWLFLSSLINHRLTGEFTTDRTMAGTSQLLDVRQEKFSDTILQRTGLSPDLFPRLVAAGEVIGTLRASMAARLGLPVGLPVIATGHDTQFALFGSGAALDQAVLSSGTWEILMVRTPQVDTSLLPRYEGSTCELDSCRGLFNPGLQWLASGTLEWVRQLYWPDDPLPAAYDLMIAEGRSIPPGCQGVRLQGQLLDCRRQTSWTGLSLYSSRGHFYRAALENLAWRLRHHLGVLQNIGGFRATGLLLVGGGSRNPLWNQIKADVLNLPINVLKDAETTVLGAAMFAWSGAGFYDSPETARQQVNYRYYRYYPGEQCGDYQQMVEQLDAMTEGE